MNLKIKIILFCVTLITILTIIYLYAMTIGTSGLKTKEYIIENNNFIEENNGFKIAHVSDIHYGNHMPIEKLEKLVEKINNLNVDLIIITGDVVDNKITEEEHNELVNCLKNLKAKYGKYSVNGNHDTYYKNYNKLIEEIGFKDINDTHEKIYISQDKYIFLSGISDSIYNKIDITERSKEIFEVLDNNENSILNILLMHEPDYIEKINYNKFDIILSGHSHNGQVRLPIIGSIYEPIGSKKYYDEMYTLNNTKLFISSGIGTSSLPIRLFNRPSFNLYRIKK